MLIICLVTDPPLNPTERDIIKSYGGWTEFLACFDLNPKEKDDVDEAMTIVKALAVDEEDKENVISEVFRERMQ